MAHHIRNSLIAFAFGTAAYIGITNYDPHPNDNHSEPDQVDYSTLMKDYVNANKVRSIEINRETSVIKGRTNQGALFESKILPNQTASVADDVLGHGGEVKVVDNPEPSIMQKAGSTLLNWAPTLLLAGIFIYFMRKQMGMGGGANAHGKSKVKLVENPQKVTFDDVAGVDEAKEDVKELVDFLKDPAKYQKLGGKIPKGVLMEGPPGTGKTLLARAVAGEAGVPFFTTSGSDFVEMFVGVGAARVRDMFDQAKKNAPCILFIDEIDAVGKQRGGMNGGNDERDQTLNAILVEMDGFEGNEGVIIIAATNQKNTLDKALIRPGRFDRQVTVGLPDLMGREQILNVHAKKVPMGDGVNLKDIARGTTGFSGADLANIINESALMAARGNKQKISMKELETAKDRIIMGAEKKQKSPSESLERMNALVAYHEAGHMIVGELSPDHDPTYKVTIIPRSSGAGGFTMFLPENEHRLPSRRHITSSIDSLFGGRIAEEMIYGEEGITTGASNDIQRATELAFTMVARVGLINESTMKDVKPDPNWKEAPILFAKSQDEHPMAQKEFLALPEKQQQLMKDFLNWRYNETYKLLEENRSILEATKDALIKYETIDRGQVEALMTGRECPKPMGWDDDQKLLAEKAEQQAVSNDNAQDDKVIVLPTPEKKGWGSFKPW